MRSSTEMLKTAVVGTRARAALAVVVIACASTACGSTAARGGYRQPAPPLAPGSPGYADAQVNIVDPVGPLFDHRVAYALSDSQVGKLEAIDSRYVADARPLRRRLDSLRTVSRDWPGYVAGGASVDTARLPPVARDSVFRLRDAIAGATAELHARARRAYSTALDVLSLEQLERVAMFSNSSGAYATQLYGRRGGGPGGGGGGGGGGGSVSGGGPTANPRNGTGGVVVSPYRTRDPLRGLVLTDSQRTTIDSIRVAYRAEARDLGDPTPATAAALRDLIRRQDDAIRAVLTPDQQEAFDKNRTPATTPQTRPKN